MSKEILRKIMFQLTIIEVYGKSEEYRKRARKLATAINIYLNEEKL